jgi:diguanylate cyclase (GGDEF)-like protein/PAS domain S-box-containing protein
MAASHPAHETERLQRLREGALLDAEPEPVFDSLVQLASQLCGAPVSLASLVDSAPTTHPLAHPLSPDQARQLRALGQIAAQALEMWRRLIDRSLSARNASESELAESEARHRAILDAQSELISQAAPDGTLVYVNPAYAAHFNLDVASILGTNLFDYIESADRGVVRERIDAVLTTGVRLIAENRMSNRGGDEQWFAWTNTRQLDAQGHPLLHSVGRDISARKRAEQALRESESLLQRTGRVAGVGGWQLDLVGSTVTWSEQTRAIHEVEPGYVPTLETAIQFYAPEARPVIEQAVTTAFETGRPWDLELPFITAKGRRIWVRAQGEAEFLDGVPVRLVGAFQDITERKRLEQRVEENERFLHLVTDSLPQRMGYLDRDLRYRFANDSNLRRFGVGRDTILGRTRAEITGVPLPAELLARYQAALGGQVQRFVLEEPGSPDGDGPRRMDCQLLPDINEHGEVRGFVTNAVDITDRSRAEQALLELTAIIENTTDFVVQTDWRGQISYMNPATRSAVGLAPDAPLTGLNFAAFNTDTTNRHFAEVIVPAVKAHGVWVGETTVRVARGRELPVSHMVIAHRDATGRVARYSAVMRDISAAAQARQDMLMQTATLRAVTEAIPAIVAVVGKDQCYRFVNSGFERWIGLPRERIIGRSLAEVLGPADLERSQLWIDRVRAGETVQFERVNPNRGDGHHLAVSYVPLYAASGAIDGFIDIGLDITVHRQEQTRLLKLSERDALTGLLNRAGLERRIEAEVQQGRGAQLAFLYVDLDHFKPVNDQHGHPAGDQVLQQFGQRVQGLIRPTDVLARLGGDEYAVLLFGVREAGHANVVAEKIIAVASAPFDVQGQQVHIGASVGVALGVRDAEGWQELVSRADTQLYRAKLAGRGQQAGMTDWMPDLP